MPLLLKWKIALLLCLLLLIEGLQAGEPILPLPRSHHQPAPKVALGRRLFHDPRLSGNGSLSCASCHVLERGGDDNRPLPVAASSPYPHNTLTVFNVRFNFRYHWYGDIAGLREQAQRALRQDMKAKWPQLVARLEKDRNYAKQFAALYPDGIQRQNVLDALVAFELSLITPDSPFDRYLRGETEAMTPLQRQGYDRFKSYGCAACHQGVNIGGNLYQKLGVFRDFIDDDPGRFAVTGREQDRFVFRVPSLRNVAVTAPYFHHGKVPTLEKAVAIMGEYQLGIQLPKDDIEAIVAFLHALTGNYRGRSLEDK